MNQKEFEIKAQVFSKEYRAECHSQKRHWKGKWRTTYSEASIDADKHRYGNNGNYQFHEVVIVEKVYSKAKVE